MTYGTPDPDNGPPPCWVASGGKLVPSDAVVDYAARRQMVRGVCRAMPCNPCIELDPDAMAAAGQGSLLMHQLQALLRRHQLEGYGPDLQSEMPLNPLLLGKFVGRPNAAFRIACAGNGRKFFSRWTVEEIFAGLAKRSHDGAPTAVETLGEIVTSAFLLCKKVNWSAEILWINAGTMGWKQTCQISFDSLESGE